MDNMYVCASFVYNHGKSDLVFAVPTDTKTEIYLLIVCQGVKVCESGLVL